MINFLLGLSFTINIILIIGIVIAFKIYTSMKSNNPFNILNVDNEAIKEFGDAVVDEQQAKATWLDK